MAEPADQRKGFSDVDRMPDPAVLVAGMDATARWPAVRTLRSWERERLAPKPGDAVLDVGCGPGDVIIELAQAVAPGGRAVGVDFSDQMLAAAGDRAASAGADVSFTQGDATKLDADDDTFAAMPGESIRVGGRLLNLLRDAGLQELEVTAATHI